MNFEKLQRCLIELKPNAKFCKPVYYAINIFTTDRSCLKQLEENSITLVPSYRSELLREYLRLTLECRLI